MGDERGWIRYEKWEDDEYVITVDGKPVGQTVDLQQASFLVGWLMTAIKEIREGK